MSCWKVIARHKLGEFYAQPRLPAAVRQAIKAATA